MTTPAPSALAVCLSSQAARKHCNKAQKHKDALAALAKADTNMEQLKTAIEDYKGFVKEEHGPSAKVVGMELTPMEMLKDRAECLEETLKAGIPVYKIDKLRPYLERRMGISLTRSDELSATFIPPLKLKEEKLLRDEFKDEYVGVYSDGTTHCGESHGI